MPFVAAGQYLVMLEGDFYWSAHSFMCENGIFLAGAIFGDVGEELLFLCALYWTLHV